MDTWRAMVYEAERRGELTPDEVDQQLNEIDMVESQENEEYGLPLIEKPMKEYGWWSDDV